MKIDLSGRKAVVTGSTAGIGRAIAEGLARAGAAVVINGRGQERVAAALRELRELFPKGEFTGVSADLATPEGAAHLFAQAPDADILVNNVGTGRPKSFFEIGDSEWIDLFELNVMSGNPRLAPLSAEHDEARLGARRLHQQRVRARSAQGHD